MPDKMSVEALVRALQGVALQPSGYSVVYLNDAIRIAEAHAAAAVAEVTRERDEAREDFQRKCRDVIAGCVDDPDAWIAGGRGPLEAVCQLQDRALHVEARVAELEAEVERLENERHEMRGEVHVLTEQLAGAKSEVEHLAAELEEHEEGGREKELEAEVKRLHEIERAAWHLCDDSQTAIELDETTITVDPAQFERLCELLPEECPHGTITADAPPARKEGE